MTRRSVRTLLFTTTALVSSIGFSPAQAQSGPQGEQVQAGSVDVLRPDGDTTLVEQSSDRAVVDWRSFDVEAGHTTTFNQPGADSITLNRVVGHDGPSQINGTIRANGHVILSNPDGILIGAGGQVDANGFVGTTHDIDTDAFMRGSLTFDRPGRRSASVVNEGTISIRDGGIAALVAPGVRNAGTIKARAGKIALGAGNGFTLDLYGDELINLDVSEPVAASIVDAGTGEVMTSLVGNSGKLSAAGGTIMLTAAEARVAVDSVINTTGLIEADSVGQEGGEIVLSAATTPQGGQPQKVEVSGEIRARGVKAGEKGGDITVTGQDVAVQNALIDASGAAGGGTILIGGDVQGGRSHAPALPDHTLAIPEANPLATAESVSVDAQSHIKASATIKGDGGKVVIWGDRIARAFGDIDASPAGGGRGGFVEVSSPGHLIYDAKASVGDGGLLFLDPNIAFVVYALPGCLFEVPYCPSGHSYITAASLSGGGGVWSADGVNIAANIVASGGLSFYSDGWLAFNAPVSSASGIVAKAGGSMTISGDLTAPSVWLEADTIDWSAEIETDILNFHVGSGSYDIDSMITARTMVLSGSTDVSVLSKAQKNGGTIAPTPTEFVFSEDKIQGMDTLSVTAGRGWVNSVIAPRLDFHLPIEAGLVGAGDWSDARSDVVFHEPVEGDLWVYANTATFRGAVTIPTPPPEGRTLHDQVTANGDVLFHDTVDVSGRLGIVSTDGRVSFARDVNAEEIVIRTGGGHAPRLTSDVIVTPYAGNYGTYFTSTLPSADPTRKTKNSVTFHQNVATNSLFVESAGDVRIHGAFRSVLGPVANVFVASANDLRFDSTTTNLGTMTHSFIAKANNIFVGGPLSLLGGHRIALHARDKIQFDGDIILGASYSAYSGFYASGNSIRGKAILNPAIGDAVPAVSIDLRQGDIPQLISFVLLERGSLAGSTAFTTHPQGFTGPSWESYRTMFANGPTGTPGTAQFRDFISGAAPARGFSLDNRSLEQLAATKSAVAAISFNLKFVLPAPPLPPQTPRHIVSQFVSLGRWPTASEFLNLLAAGYRVSANGTVTFQGQFSATIPAYLRQQSDWIRLVSQQQTFLANLETTIIVGGGEQTLTLAVQEAESLHGLVKNGELNKRLEESSNAAQRLKRTTDDAFFLIKLFDALFYMRGVKGGLAKADDIYDVTKTIVEQDLERDLKKATDPD